MKSNVSRIEERQFITKEFADTIAGKAPAPYLRLHDPVQKKLVEIDPRLLKTSSKLFCHEMKGFFTIKDSSSICFR
jgi:hypothetical protein